MTSSLTLDKLVCMDKIVGVKELRENLPSYIKKIQAGKSFTVVKRSKPVFKITPPDEEGAWEEVVDLTRVRKGGVSISDILSEL